MRTVLHDLFWSMVLLTTICWHATAAATQVHHDLNVRLELARQQLTGEDTISLENTAPEPLTLHLATQAHIDAVTLNDQPIEYRFRGGMIHLQIPPAISSHETRIAMRYQSRFDDPGPVRPINTDNPGYGVTGTISAAGVLLLSGAGWLTPVPDLVAIENDHYQLAGTVFKSPSDAFFMVAGEPGHPQALFWPLSDKAASEAWRKITHYGTYSHLAFRGGRNRQKGIWPVAASPVRFLWADNQAP